MVCTGKGEAEAIEGWYEQRGPEADAARLKERLPLQSCHSEDYRFQEGRNDDEPEPLRDRVIRIAAGCLLLALSVPLRTALVAMSLLSNLTWPGAPSNSCAVGLRWMLRFFPSVNLAQSLSSLLARGTQKDQPPSVPMLLSLPAALPTILHLPIFALTWISPPWLASSAPSQPQRAPWPQSRIAPH